MSVQDDARRATGFAMSSRWSVEDNNALVAQYDARKAAGVVGPADFELPSATDHRLAVIAFATSVGFFAAALVPGKERRPLSDPRRWSSLIKERMVHRILKCCADCAWAGAVYNQQKADADEVRRRSNVQAAKTHLGLKRCPTGCSIWRGWTRSRY